MAKSVNHHERKREICATSIRLFAQRGYEDVNFGNIAKECGLSRTLVYTYFKDKRTIFNQAIFELTTAVAEKYILYTKVNDNEYDGSVEYRVHVEKIGWQENDIVKLFWTVGLISCMVSIIWGVIL